jgi:multiple sugar transport system permease protein
MAGRTQMVAESSVSFPQRAIHTRRRLFDNQAFCGLLFVAPALLGFTLFYLLPTIRAFYIGLTNWNLLRAPKFLGFDNYARLFNDGKFWSSIWVTVL